jgi:hypothetical protein
MSDELEDSLKLTRQRRGWAGYSDPRFEGPTGMYGGWTAALLLHAVLSEDRATGEPAGLTVNFAARTPAGRALRITSEYIAGGRRVQHWLVRLGDDEGSSFAQALVVLSERAESGEFVEPKMPNAPEPTSLEVHHPPGAVGAFVESRPVSGLPPIGQKDTRSAHWVCETSGRPMDAVQVAFLSDNTAPRSLYLPQTPTVNATLTLSVYFLADSDEMSCVGQDFLLNETIGTRAAGSLAGQQSRLWSRQGALLATTEQLSWFK